MFSLHRSYKRSFDLNDTVAGVPDEIPKEGKEF